MANEFMIYSLLALPFLGTAYVGYGKTKVASFFGATIFLGAISVLFTYLVFNLQAALTQLAALGAGTALFLIAVQLLGDRFTYRSPLLLMSSVGLLPVGLLWSYSYVLAPLIAFGSIMVLNIGFALLLAQLRKNALGRNKKKDQELSKPRYVLTAPTLVAVLTVAAMMLIEFSSIGVFEFSRLN